MAASCAGVSGWVPEAPQVSATTMISAQELMETKREILDYVAIAEQRLPCIASDVRHNYVVDQMHKVAEEYNRLLRVCKQCLVRS